MPNRPLLLVLPYVGPLSLQTRTKLRESLKVICNRCKLQIVFQIQNKLANGFVLNITFHKDVLKNGERVRHLNVRIGEHIGISPLTKKKVKHKRSAVSHLLKVSPSFESFSTNQGK